MARFRRPPDCHGDRERVAAGPAAGHLAIGPGAGQGRAGGDRRDPQLTIRGIAARTSEGGSSWIRWPHLAHSYAKRSDLGRVGMIEM